MTQQTNKGLNQNNSRLVPKNY